MAIDRGDEVVALDGAQHDVSDAPSRWPSAGTSRRSAISPKASPGPNDLPAISTSPPRRRRTGRPDRPHGTRPRRPDADLLGPRGESLQLRLGQERPNIGTLGTVRCRRALRRHGRSSAAVSGSRTRGSAATDPRRRVPIECRRASTRAVRASHPIRAPRSGGCVTLRMHGRGPRPVPAAASAWLRGRRRACSRGRRSGRLQNAIASSGTPRTTARERRRARARR